MRRAIVSGISGHLGRELARQLATSGVEAHGITRRPSAVDLPGHQDGRLHHFDGDTEALVGIFERIRPEAVFHCAGFSRRHHLAGDVIPLVHANVLFGTQLLEAMKATGCPRIVIAGTYLQHFNTDSYRAFDLYAATKQAFETMVEYYVDAYSLSAVRLTLADIYSETDTRPKLLTDIARARARNMPLRLRGHEAWIDPIHVSDAASAFLQASALLESDALPSPGISRYSVSSGRDISATQITEMFERLGGRAIAVERAANDEEPRKMRPWRGAMLPGWTPRITLEEGIRRIVQTGDRR